MNGENQDNGQAEWADALSEVGVILNRFRVEAKEHPAVEPDLLPAADDILNCDTRLLPAMLAGIAQQFRVPAMALFGATGFIWLRKAFLALLKRDPSLDDTTLRQLARTFTKTAGQTFVPADQFINYLTKRNAKLPLSADLRFDLATWADTLAGETETASRKAAVKVRALIGFNPYDLGTDGDGEPDGDAAVNKAPQSDAPALSDGAEETAATDLVARYLKDVDEIERGPHGRFTISKAVEREVEQASPLLRGAILVLALEALGKRPKKEHVWPLSGLVDDVAYDKLDFAPADFARMLNAMPKAMAYTRTL